MTYLPIFSSDISAVNLVKEVRLDINLHAGFGGAARINIDALHTAARAAGYEKVLEVSTRSADELGRALSAFKLQVRSKSICSLVLERAYQGSKVFERGGPYTDLYAAELKTLKSDRRLRTSGALIGFEFAGRRFPAMPTTGFYDWLYLNALLQRPGTVQRLADYSGFTDIAFDPRRSVACQARSCALAVSLFRLDLLDNRIQSPEHFFSLIEPAGTR